MYILRFNIHEKLIEHKFIDLKIKDIQFIKYILKVKGK
jgi:hypothetical protein